MERRINPLDDVRLRAGHRRAQIGEGGVELVTERFAHVVNPDARALLEDVVISRISILGQTFVAGFQLLAEPSMVIEEMGFNYLDNQDFARSTGITVPDIEAAVGDGRLVTSFRSPAEYGQHLRQRHLPSDTSQYLT